MLNVASPITSWQLIVISTFTLIYKNFASESSLNVFQHSFCDAEIQTRPDQIWWLSPFIPPCLHPGQPVFTITDSNAGLPVQFRSDDLSVDLEARLAFTKRRICFYSTFWDVVMKFRCPYSNTAQIHKLRIGHPIFSKTKRKKRWVRRRNPLIPSIHFQQERYITEVREDIPVGSLIVKVHATHMNNESIYYSMSAPEDSRSTNSFTLDTVTGEIRLVFSPVK